MCICSSVDLNNPPLPPPFNKKSLFFCFLLYNPYVLFLLFLPSLHFSFSAFISLFIAKGKARQDMRREGKSGGSVKYGKVAIHCILAPCSDNSWICSSNIYMLFGSTMLVINVARRNLCIQAANKTTITTKATTTTISKW